MSLNIIPEEIISQYKLRKISVNGWVYIKIRKGMPGLKQARKISHDRLKNRLKKYGFRPCHHTPALRTHATRPIFFTLVVDDFGVKYVGGRHLDHLINALRDNYKITVDLPGNSYLDPTIDWNYAQGYVNISMPNFVRKSL